MNLSIGVIGCGGISQMMHLPFLFERPDMFRVLALSDVSSATLEAVGRRYRVTRLFESYQELLEEPVDAVLIANSGSHLEPVLAAIGARKHIFCEKPLGQNTGEVQAIAKAIEGTGLTLMVGYHKRYDPGYLAAREEVRRLQDLRYVRCEVLHPVDSRARDHYYLEPPRDPARRAMEDDESRDGWLAEIAGGPSRTAVEAVVGPDAPVDQRGAVLALFGSLIHDVNAVRGILGEPEEVEFAEFWRDGRCMHIVVRWTKTVRVTFSWIYLPGLNNYREELLFASPESRVTLRFPSPYFRHFPTMIRVETCRDEGGFEERIINPGLEEAFRCELHHFHECVSTGRTPITDISDAMADTMLLEAMARTYTGSRVAAR